MNDRLIGLLLIAGFSLGAWTLIIWLVVTGVRMVTR